MTKRVLVTGASGFIGKWITKDLLDNGYEVRGSVRSSKKADETRAAVGASADSPLDFVELDLLSDTGWAEALDGVDYLLHTASPFPISSPKDPDDLIKPAVEGTRRALEAAVGAGVNRVVITSSVAAIYGDDLAAGQTEFDETNWSPTGTSATSAYEDSKTLAERFAWDFAEQNSELQLSTVNPGVVWGPPLDQNYGSSLELVERLLDGKDPMLPDFGVPVCDVRDVATVHRLALQKPDAVGKRLPVAKGALTLIEAAEILNSEIGSSKAKARKAPDWMIRFMALFMSDMKSVAPRLGKTGAVSPRVTEGTLGIELKPARDSLISSAEFIVESR